MLFLQNARERDEWISSLKKTLMLTEDRRRTDNSLKMSVVEVSYNILYLI